MKNKWNGLILFLAAALVLPWASSVPERPRWVLREALPATPPFVAPHHSVSSAALVGGGSGLARPGAVSLAVDSGQYDGFVAIGVVIRGETYHFEIVAGESARGIMALTMDGMAIGNGILTVENEQQAIVRADPAQKDKGGEAAKAALALYELRQRFGN